MSKWVELLNSDRHVYGKVVHQNLDESLTVLTECSRMVVLQPGDYLFVSEPITFINTYWEPMRGLLFWWVTNTFSPVRIVEYVASGFLHCTAEDYSAVEKVVREELHAQYR